MPSLPEATADRQPLPADGDTLHAVIAAVLEAEEAGVPVDRDALIDRHRELAGDLRRFPADHDRMRRLGRPAEVAFPSIQPADPESTLDDAPTDADATVDHHPTAQASPDSDRPRRFGNYELLGEIARGGMGVVYRARQLGLNRPVALKMVRAGKLASEEHQRRFQAEAEATARLDHPGIVPIYDIGRHGDQPFYAMALIDGVSLHEVVRDGPLPPRTAAEVVRRLAETMAVVHQRGIVHRDLKPSNVLLAPAGADGIAMNHDSTGSGRFEPKITDFGLAKQTDLEDSGMTESGQVLGTPSYMPPEQAAGDANVGPLADVYSLGAVLYCLLTGRPPFQAAHVLDTLAAVRNDEPVPPRRLNAAVPKDLETVTLKCLGKRPAERYGSAAALAADLKRFLSGQPIAARPVTRAERLIKWVRRHPTATGLIAATVVALVALGAAGVATVFYRQQSELRQNADQYLYFNRINLAGRSVEETDLGRARTLLAETPPESRGWEWDYLDRQANPDQTVLTDGHKGTIVGLTYTADGRFLLSGDSSGTVCVWDVRRGRLLNKFAFATQLGNVLTHCRFTREGRHLLVSQQRETGHLTLMVYPIDVLCLPGANKRSIAPAVRTYPSLSFNALAGNLMVPEDGDVYRGVGTLNEQPGLVRRYDRASDTDAEFVRTALPYPNLCVLSPTGDYFIAHSLNREPAWGEGTGGSAIEIWSMAETSSADPIARFDYPEGSFSFAVGQLPSAEDATQGDVRPDQTLLAISLRDGTIELYRSPGFDSPMVLTGHTAIVRNLIFSRDSRTLASISEDRTIRLWDLTDALTDSGRVPRSVVLTGHTGGTERVAFNPQGTTLASAAVGNDIILHDLSSAGQTEVVAQSRRPVLDAGFTADGSAIVWVTTGGRIMTRSLGAASERLIAEHRPPPEGKRQPKAGSMPTGRIGRPRTVGEVHDGAVSPDGRWVAFGEGDWADPYRIGTVSLWNVEKGREVHRLDAAPRIVRNVGFSDDGRTLPGSGGEMHRGPGAATLFDVQTGRETFRADSAWGVFRCDLSHDDRFLETVSNTMKPNL